jgi:molybdate transport system substrate-binding protein
MKNCQSTSLVALLIVIFLTGCSALPPTSAPDAAPAASDAVTLKVFAPSSMTDAAKELAAAYETANPGVKLAIEIGHSPTQRLQLTQGATGDVFITASQKDMDDAVTDGSVGSGAARVFAMNQLTVVLPPENPANLASLEDLANDGIRLLVAVVDTPIGKVTLTSMDKMEQQLGPGFKDRVLANVVSNEAGVKPIVSKLQLGEADAGVVFVTDAVAAPALKTLEIPPELNVITQLNIAPLATAPNPEEAAAFVAFVTSADGQTILKKWGFLPGQS